MIDMAQAVTCERSPGSTKSRLRANPTSSTGLHTAPQSQGYAFTTAFMNIWVNVNDLQAVRSFIHHSLSLVETRPRLFDFIHSHSRSS